MLAIIGHILVAGFTILGLIFWLRGAYYLARTCLNRQPGVSLFWVGLYKATDLMPEGIVAQHKYRLSIMGFLVCTVLSILTGLATGVLHAVHHVP